MEQDLPDNNNNINTKNTQREKVFYPQKGIHYGEQKHMGAGPNTCPVEGKAHVAHLQWDAQLFLSKPWSLVTVWIV